MPSPSELELTRAKLHACEERLRLVTEHVHDVFYVVGRDGCVEYVSPAFERTWARASTELRGMSWCWPFDVHDDDWSDVAAAVAALRRGEPFDVEYRIVREDGTVRFVHDRAFAVLDDAERLLRIVGVAHDVTRERELEIELRQAQKVEALGSLASGIAHDFNNVLQIIVSCAALAADEQAPPEQVRKVARRAKDVALRAGELVRQLTSFSRKEHAKRTPLLLDATVARIAGLVQAIVGEHIRVDVACDAPGTRVLAAEVQLEQVLLNLASNARDAMPAGGTMRIGTRVMSTGTHGRVCLDVKDTGCGIDAVTKERIFDPFFTTKASGKGTGLGLASVASVAEQLGGDVLVDSEVGKGTTFSVVLPVCCEAEVHAYGPPRAALRLEGTALLVEDDPFVRHAVGRDLEHLGLRVLEAVDVEHAFALFEAHHPHVLVTDILMPMMTGASLAERLHARDPALRTLFISGDPRGEVDGAEAASHTAFLWKPFRTEELANALVALLPSSAERGERGGAPGVSAQPESQSA